MRMYVLNHHQLLGVYKGKNGSLEGTKYGQKASLCIAKKWWFFFAFPPFSSFMRKVGMRIEVLVGSGDIF